MLERENNLYPVVQKLSMLLVNETLDFQIHDCEECA